MSEVQRFEFIKPQVPRPAEVSARQIVDHVERVDQQLFEGPRTVGSDVVGEQIAPYFIQGRAAEIQHLDLLVSHLKVRAGILETTQLLGDDGSIQEQQSVVLGNVWGLLCTAGHTQLGIVASQRLLRI